MSTFSNPDVVSDYARRTARVVPGLHDIHRMTGLLLAERVPVDGRVLVLGAGGGMELRAIAEMYSGWRFDGVDPSPEMLAQAKVVLGDAASRVELHEGYIYDAPDGPFDGATCLLTLHFLHEAERLRTVRAVHSRLKSGAPFVVMHHSFPTSEREKDRWLARFAAFSATPDTSLEQIEKNIAGMKEHLPVLSPDQDVAVLRDAGFRDIELFYAGFTFKGWVGYKE